MNFHQEEFAHLCNGVRPGGKFPPGGGHTQLPIHDMGKLRLGSPPHADFTASDFLATIFMLQNKCMIWNLLGSSHLQGCTAHHQARIPKGLYDQPDVEFEQEETSCSFLQSGPLWGFFLNRELTYLAEVLPDISDLEYILCWVQGKVAFMNTSSKGQDFKMPLDTPHCSQ